MAWMLEGRVNDKQFFGKVKGQQIFVAPRPSPTARTATASWCSRPARRRGVRSRPCSSLDLHRQRRRRPIARKAGRLPRLCALRRRPFSGVHRVARRESQPPRTRVDTQRRSPRRDPQGDDPISTRSGAATAATPARSEQCNQKCESASGSATRARSRTSLRFSSSGSPHDEGKSEQEDVTMNAELATRG